jgi:phosphoribosylformylglycinamidine synthase
MALDGNGRWCYLDPKLGAKHAVAEAARKVACTGATPVAATNCLNFGNPEKPEIMAQLANAIDGIAEACVALGTPITGGNVSLYNETRGEGIYPTPVLGIVGVLDDVTKSVGADLVQAGQAILLLCSAAEENALTSFGSSEYAKVVLASLWGTPPALDLAAEAGLQKSLAELAQAELLHSARDVSDGGLAVTLAESGFRSGVGAMITLQAEHGVVALFGEEAGRVVVSCDYSNVDAVRKIAEAHKVTVQEIGSTAAKKLEIRLNGSMVVSERVEDLRSPWDHALEAMLHDEVMA